MKGEIRMISRFSKSGKGGERVIINVPAEHRDEALKLLGKELRVIVQEVEL